MRTSNDPPNALESIRERPHDPLQLSTLFNADSPKKLVSFFGRMIFLSRLIAPFQRLSSAKADS